MGRSSQNSECNLNIDPISHFIKSSSWNGTICSVLEVLANIVTPGSVPLGGRGARRAVGCVHSGKVSPSLTATWLYQSELAVSAWLFGIT